MKLLIMKFSPSSHHFLSLRFKYSQQPVFRHPQSVFFPSCCDHIAHLYRTTGILISAARHIELPVPNNRNFDTIIIIVIFIKYCRQLLPLLWVNSSRGHRILTEYRVPVEQVIQPHFCSCDVHGPLDITYHQVLYISVCNHLS
jgi:hypothetical protein